MKKSTYLLSLLFLLSPFYGASQHPGVADATKRQHFIEAATALRAAGNYTGAICQLDSILLANNNDAPIILFKGDLQLQSGQFKAAADSYRQLLELDYRRTIVQINLSYALFMDHKPGNALKYARLAWEGDKMDTNAIINYFNAQLWNVKTGKAAGFLARQQQQLSPAHLLVLKARLYSACGDYARGLLYYDSLVTVYPDKQHVREYAEVLLGRKESKRAAGIFVKGALYFSTNEQQGFAQKLKAADLQQAGTEFTWFTDIAKNSRMESSAWWQQPEGRRYRLGLRAGLSTLTSAQHDKTNAQFAHFSVNERWTMALSGQTDVHLQLIQPTGSGSFTSLTARQSLQYQPNDRRMAGVFVSTDILNYTASLLNKNIRSNSVGYVTHIMLGGKNGIYSQGSINLLTDKNSSTQFFGSLYHLFRTAPTVKMGMNFSTLHYKDSSIKTYFSPNRYMSTEIFGDYSAAVPQLPGFYLQMQAAAGMQKIENEQWQPAMRVQAELGLRLAHFETALKYQNSNVASAAGTGYSFNSLTCRLLWKW